MAEVIEAKVFFTAFTAEKGGKEKLGNGGGTERGKSELERV